MVQTMISDISSSESPSESAQRGGRDFEVLERIRVPVCRQAGSANDSDQEKLFSCGDPPERCDGGQATPKKGRNCQQVPGFT